MMRAIAWCVVAAVCAAFSPAQGESRPAAPETLTVPDGGQVTFVVALPAGAAPERALPVAILHDREPAGDSLAIALVKAGWAAVTVTRQSLAEHGASPVAALCRKLRLRLFPEGCRFYSVTGVAATLRADEVPEFINGTSVVAARDDAGTMQLLEALRAATRRTSADEQAASDVLDVFCDAASRADAARYFGLFAPDGVFFGTDASERWSAPDFRKWAEQYFRGKSAWIFVPVARHLVMSEDRAQCWFDEALYSVSYGDCRGTGALRKIDGTWRIAQYNLSIPIPNDLAGEVVKRIRAFEHAAGAPTGPTTIYFARHAEKETSNPKDTDPPLTAAGQVRAQDLYRTLQSVGVTKVYTSDKQRTQQTAEPFRAAGVARQVLPATDPPALLAALKAEKPGSRVLVVSHANVIPTLLRQLGVAEKVELGESDYDDLFAVTLGGEGSPRLQHLHYGAPSGAK